MIPSQGIENAVFNAW